MEKTGTVVEILPFDKCSVKLSGSNRLMRRNRRFLRAYTPAATQERMIVPVEQRDEKDRDIESAWGTRDHVLPSSDSISPTDSSQMLPATDREPIFTKSQDHSQPSVQPTIPSQTQGVGLRRSSRSTKGKTTRFDDCVTGEELEALGDDP